MKYIIGLALLCLLGTDSVKACDICGCSSGHYFIGPFPNYHKNYIGVRFSYRKFFSRMENDPGAFSRDRYQTVELAGSFSLGKRWQLMGFLPYNMNRQEMELHPHKEEGAGDISLLLHYRLLNSHNQNILAGLGLKLPTGNFNPGFAHHPVPSANIQPGSGSVDYIFNLLHTLSMNRWSMHNNVNAKLNGSRQEFRFGGRFAVSSVISRSVGKGSNFHPYAGLQYEYQGGNQYQQEKIQDTGGQGLLATTGADLNLGNFSLGLNIQVPLAQRFSTGQTEVKSRGMLRFGMLF